MERTEAQRELLGLIAENLDTIEQAAQEGPTETALRVVESLESVFLKNEGELGERVEQALQRLSIAGGPGSVSAGLVLQSNALLRESRARAALEKLGAQFVYYKPDSISNGQALFGLKAAVLPEVGVGFGHPAVLQSIYIHEDWTGKREDLWHFTRLANQRDLAIYTIKGNSVELNDLFLLARYLRGLSIQERGACLGIRSEPFSSNCIVGTVVRDGAADKGGLVNGDVVFQLEETRIRNFPHLVQTLQDFKIGDEVTFTIFRNGEQMEKVVKLGSWRDVSFNDELSVDSPPLFKGPFAPLIDAHPETSAEPVPMPEPEKDSVNEKDDSNSVESKPSP